MSLNIYLFFDGNCAEAFNFYKSVFGGDFMVCSPYSEAPPDMGVREEDGDKIMHISYPIGGSVLMGSENVEGFGQVRPAGGNFAISYEPGSREEADDIFARLLEGGEVQMPMQETFWGSYFGQGKDRFGIMWMLNLDEQQG